MIDIEREGAIDIERDENPRPNDFSPRIDFPELLRNRYTHDLRGECE